MECIIYFHSKLNNICHVSPHIATTWSQCKIRYVKIIWPDQQTPFYTSWIGDIAKDSPYGSSGEVNIIGISRLQVFEKILHEGQRVVVNVVTNYLSIVKEICMSPLTNNDWDIVSTQANLVERTFLQQNSIISNSQRKRILVNTSLSANFEVKSITFHTPSHQTIGIINDTTTIIIEPYNNQQPQAESALSIRSDQVVDNILTKVKELEKQSSQSTLRVLPPTLRDDNTSFFHDALCKSIDFKSSDIIPNLDLFDDLSQAGLNCNNDTMQQLKVFNKLDNVGLVNPYFYQSLAQIVLNNPQAVWSNQNSEVICHVAHITIDSTSLDQSDQGLVHHQVILLLSHPVIRPNFISLPSSIMQSMGLHPFDKVHLHLQLQEKAQQPSFPRKIRLRPICNQAIESIPYSDSKENAVIISSFLQIIQENLKSTGLCLIATGNIITIHRFQSMVAAPNADGLPNTSILSNQEKSQFIIQLDQGMPPSLSNDDSSSVRTTEQLESILPKFWHEQFIMLSENYIFSYPACFHHGKKTIELLINAIEIDNAHAIQYPSRSAFYQNDHEMAPPVGLIHGFEDIFREVLCNILSHCLPTALVSISSVHSWNRGSVSHTLPGLLLIGEAGMGKTYFLNHVTEFCHDHPRLLINIERIDGKALKVLPIEQILSSLTTSFTNAMKNAPSVVCIDDLDELCPASSENIQSGLSAMREDRHTLISLHLSQLLCHVSKTQPSNHIGEVFDRETKEGLYNACQSILHRLERTVFVLASSQSRQSINPHLLDSRYNIHKIVSLPFLVGKKRIHLFLSLLKASGVVITQSKGSNAVQRLEDKLLHALENFRYCDVKGVVNRIALTAYRKMASLTMKAVKDSLLSSHADTLSMLTISTEELFHICNEYVPFSISSNPLPSRNKTAQHNEIDWKDVGGYQSVKRSIYEIIKYPLIFNKLFSKAPIKLPRAILLYGPPGCGKTYIGHAAGREFGGGFISIKGPELLDKYIGASEKAVRDLFNRAKSFGRPCLILFDEFEALAAKRGRDNTGVTDRIVNQLLTFIDGVEDTMTTPGHGDDDEEKEMSNGKIFIIAVTSRPDLVDEALLRPGRIEKHIYIGLPSLADRQSILISQLRRSYEASNSLFILDDVLKSIIDQISLDGRTNRMTAADLKALVNNAYLIAVQEKIDELNIETNTGQVKIRSRHMISALDELRPSISEMDLAYYEKIYEKFSGGKKSKKKDLFQSDQSESVADNDHLTSLIQSIDIRSNQKIAFL